MRALLIGGTGTISTAVTKRLLLEGWEVFLLNRGSKPDLVPQGARVITGDIAQEEAIRSLIKDYSFETVVQFVAYHPEEVERDIRLFTGKTKQYVFISSASAYQKPVRGLKITESTPLHNPYWDYSRSKASCEERLMEAMREQDFPVTIVRPSHTYGERSVPVGIYGHQGSWQVIQRILDCKPVIIHGDGTSLWTMTHNSDFAAGFTGLMGNDHAIGQAVHITSDEVVTWNQVYAIIAGHLNRPLHAVHIASELLAQSKFKDFSGSLLGDKANSVWFDNTKLKTLVPEFTAKIRVDQGLGMTLDYILSHPELQQKDPAFDQWCDRVIALYTVFSSQI